MKNKTDKPKKVRNGCQDDLQQRISALQNDNVKLQEKNANLTFARRKLMLDLKQAKLNLTAIQITHKEDKIKCAEKIRTLEAEIANIKKTRPTVVELMSNLGQGISIEEEAKLISDAEHEASKRDVSRYLKKE